MAISKGNVVTIKYTLRIEEEVIDQGDLDYLQGYGNIVEGLEKAMEGKNIGDTFEVSVSPQEGYGVYDPEGVQEISIKDFPEGMEIEPQMQFYAEDAEGNPSPFTVMAVEEDRVMIDFNHDLAGETLEFNVEVLAIRDATEEELQHGHAHGANGHNHE